MVAHYMTAFVIDIIIKGNMCTLYKACTFFFCLCLNFKATKREFAFPYMFYGFNYSFVGPEFRLFLLCVSM